MLGIKKENILHNLFMMGIAIKVVNGFLELISGIILMMVRTDKIINAMQMIFQHELFQDPTDLIANYVIQAAQHLSIDTISFIAIYLTLHGVIKIGLVAGLWFKRTWAYPLAGIILGLVISYQIFRIYNTHSVILSIFTLVDISILILLKFEYKRITMKIKKRIGHDHAILT